LLGHKKGARLIGWAKKSRGRERGAPNFGT
jgi:hypothetical protein